MLFLGMFQVVNKKIKKASWQDNDQQIVVKITLK